MKKIATCALLVATLLAGCASQKQLGDAALARNDPKMAAVLLRQAVDAGDISAWNNLGVAYTRLKMRDQAIQAYTMSARYGNAMAVHNLTLYGVKPPVADLAAQKMAFDQARAAQAAAEQTAALQSLNRNLEIQNALRESRGAPDVVYVEREAATPTPQAIQLPGVIGSCVRNSRSVTCY